MPESQSGTLDVNGGKLYYEVSGEGSALVFIHAGIAESRMWDEQVVYFANRYRVIRYDTRGYGKTTTQDVEYSNRQDLLALLDQLGVDKAVLVGCSRGGQIATDFTLEFPDRVTALIPVCAGLGGFEADSSDEDVRFEELERLEELGDYDALTEAEVEIWVDGFQRTSDQVASGLRRRVYDMIRANYAQHANEGGKPIVLDPPAIERLHSIRVPTLVIVTDMDTVYIRAAADALANGIPGAQKVMIANSAHVPNMEHPDEFNQVVQKFLETI